MSKSSHKNSYFLMVLFMFLVPLKLLAIEFYFDIDKTEISMGEEVEVRLVLNGEKIDAEDPKLEYSNTDYQLDYVGPSSQVNIINGQVSSKKVYHFNLSANKEGSFTIGPATINVNGQSLKAKPVSFKVVKGSTTQLPKDRPFFIETDVSNKNPYINEQVIYTFRFYRRVNVEEYNPTFPDFKDFWRETLQEGKEYRTTKNNIPWVVHEVRLALFPNHSGEILIPGVKLKFVAILKAEQQMMGSPFDSFFGPPSRAQRINLNSEDIKLNVKDLPLVNRPANFKNLVGQFQLQTLWGNKSVKAGESVTLTLNILGTGNIRDVELKGDIPDYFKIYDDKPTLKFFEDDGVLKGKKTWSRALIPNRSGRLEFPALSLEYFDPSTHEYKTLKSAAAILDVSGSFPSVPTDSSNMGTTAAGLQDIKVVGQDLMPPMRTLKNGFKFPIPFLIILNLIIPFFLLLFNLRKSFKQNNGPTWLASLIPQKGPFQKFKKALNKEMGKSSPSLPHLFDIFRSYLGDKIQTDGKILTSSDLITKYATHLSEDLLKEIHQLFTLIDEIRYGLRQEQSLDSVKIGQNLEKLAQRIEDSWK